MIVGKALGQVAAGGGSKAGEGVADHLLGVERIHNGLTDLDVVPRRLGDVEHDEAGAEALNVVNLAASALELIDGVSGNELHDERGAFLLSSDASGGVGQDAVLDLLVLGSILTVVLGVGNQGDLGVGDGIVHPGPEPIGCLARSSSAWVAGVTRMMARRSLSREKLGTLVLTVTVLASLASMDSKGWKNGA